MKKEVWVIVANSTYAKIYKAESNKSLKEISRFEHPASRLHEQDLVSSKPGRTFESVGPARHAVEPKTSAKDRSHIPPSYPRVEQKESRPALKRRPQLR